MLSHVSFGMPAHAQVRSVFDQLRDDSWLVLDASQPPDVIAARVLEAALEAVKRCQEGQPLLQLWDRSKYTGALPQGSSGGGVGSCEADGAAAAGSEGCAEPLRERGGV